MKHAFRPWEEARVSRRIPLKHRENPQTPHKKYSRELNHTVYVGVKMPQSDSFRTDDFMRLSIGEGMGETGKTKSSVVHFI